MGFHPNPYVPDKSGFSVLLRNADMDIMFNSKFSLVILIFIIFLLCKKELLFILYLAPLFSGTKSNPKKRASCPFFFRVSLPLFIPNNA